MRVVRAVRGAVRFRLECQPAFDYTRRPHQITLEGRGAVFEAPGMRFSLVSRFPLARQGTGVATEFLLHPGEPSTFILRQVEGDGNSGLLEATSSTSPDAPERAPARPHYNCALALIVATSFNASAISGISGVGAKPSSAGERTLSPRMLSPARCIQPAEPVYHVQPPRPICGAVE